MRMSLTKKAIKIAMFTLFLGGTTVSAQIAPQVPQEQSTGEISDVELQKFANAYMLIQLENQKMQKEMLAVIEKEDLEPVRFNEIHEATMKSDNSVSISATEKQSYENVLGVLSNKQTAFQEKIESMIVDKGLTLDRYQEVAMALQSDVELQQKLQTMMQQ